MMRKLAMKNEKGQLFAFDYTSRVLITDLDGFGFQEEITYLKYQNFYEVAKKEQAITKMNARLVFLEGYMGYTKFIDYLKQSRILELHYEANGHKLCYVEVARLEKKELVQNTLQSLITLDKISPWLRQTKLSVEVSESNEVKSFSHSYPHSYGHNFEGKIPIQNLGVSKAPLRIEIEGKVKNPEVHVYQNKQRVSTLRLFIEEDDVTIVVDATAHTQQMIAIKNGIEENIYPLQDFEEDNFLFIEPGTCELEFKPGVNYKTLCRVTLTEIHKGH